jgi:hypothetical protein
MIKIIGEKIIIITIGIIAITIIKIWEIITIIIIGVVIKIIILFQINNYSPFF